MKSFGLEISEGHTIKNLVLPSYASGTTVDHPDPGELAYFTGTNAGAYLYDGSAWNLIKTNYQLPTYTGDVSSSGSTLTLSNVGVAGTYTKVTTDEKGRVTSGSNPTTLSGYGITDSVSSADNLLPLTNSIISSTTDITTVVGVTTIDQTSTDYRSIKYLIQVTSGTEYQSVEIMLIHNDVNAYISIYQGASTAGDLGNFDAILEGGFVKLTFDPLNASNTIKIFKIQIRK